MRRILIVALLLAQAAAASPKEFLGGFASDLVHDQKAIWTSPKHLADRKILIRALPFIATTGALIATDHRVMQALPRNESLINWSNDISQAGAAVTLVSLLGATWGTGYLTHNPTLAETGRLTTEAVIDAEVVVTVLKYATRRQRPDQGDGGGHFWHGGDSFPSGHAIAWWSIAAVTAREYRRHKWVGVTAYSVATLVSLSRIGARHHFPSDVFVGGVFGELIGGYVYNTHAVP